MVKIGTYQNWNQKYICTYAWILAVGYKHTILMLNNFHLIYWIASGNSTFILISNWYREQVKSWVNVDYWDRIGHVKETSELHYGKELTLSCTRLGQMTNTSFLVWVCVKKTSTVTSPHVHSLKRASQQRQFLLRLVKSTSVL